MPSIRPSNFVDAEVLEGTERALPPASAELRAPADVAERSDARRRRQHPTKIGRRSAEEQEEAIATVFEGMRKELTVGEMAAEAGLSQDGRKVRDIMETAKEKMQRRVGEYVDIHMVAAKVAALKGDAEPAQWALENIAVEGERVVTPPQKNLPPVAPTFNLGFVIGGMPARVLPPSSEK